MKKDILFSLLCVLLGVVLFSIFNGKGHGLGLLDVVRELIAFAGTCFVLLGGVSFLVFYVGGRIERK